MEFSMPLFPFEKRFTGGMISTPNGRAVSVQVSYEVYEYLDQADHKDENLAHEQRRHWDMRELDEYIIAHECSMVHILTPEQWPMEKVS